MPKPLLLGEVARRSRDGEVEPIVQRLIFLEKVDFGGGAVSSKKKRYYEMLIKS